MPSDTLLRMATRCAIRHIDTLYDIGNSLPYSFWRPILIKVQNPDQLRDLEVNCPQLEGETGEIWLRFIKRDISGWQNKRHEPSDPKNWWKVYRKLKVEGEREQKAQEEELKERMRKLNEDKQNNTTVITDARTTYTPVRHRRFGGPIGPKPPPAAKNAKSALDKLKRSMYDQNQARPKAAMMPNKLLEERRGRVLQAPKSMVEGRRPMQLGAPRTKTWTGNANTATASPTATTHAADLAAKEARLRNLTGGGANSSSSTPTTHPSPPATYSSPSGETYRAPSALTASTPALKKRKRPVVNPFMASQKRFKP